MIEGKWNDLLASLEACKNMLSCYHDLMSVFSEMNDCLANMAQIEVSQRETYSPTYFPFIFISLLLGALSSIVRYL